MATGEAVSQPRTPDPAARRRRRAVAASLIAVLAVLAAVAGLALAGLAWFDRQFADRIYPGLIVGSLDAGGLTRNEAIQRVARHYADQRLVAFEWDGQKWFARLPEIGITVDATRAVELAFAVGRIGSPAARFDAWRNRSAIPVGYRYDPAAAREFLARRQADVAMPARDARLEIDPAVGVARAVAAVPGRELDVDATLRDLQPRALSGAVIPVLTRPVPPAVSDVSQPAAVLDDWLSRPFSFRAWWAGAVVTRVVTPGERVGWVAAVLEGGAWVARWNDAGVRDFLAGFNQELGDTADLRLDETATMTRRAFERGDDSLWLAVPYRQHRYVIQDGDTFESLGDRYGIPVARLLTANPDIWQGGFVPGQAITIPAQSIMMPLPITPTHLKHIEVDLSAQQLWAYDGPAAVLSATISSGIPKWRTLVGLFQVLERVDEAYNKLAHIKMPNWLSIYDIGDPGESLTNGIHALPVLGGGRRLWDGYLGRPVSFGCVVMGIADSDFLYGWAEIGTPVVIYGQTPPSPLTYDNLIEARDKTQQPAPAESPSQSAPAPASAPASAP